MSRKLILGLVTFSCIYFSSAHTQAGDLLSRGGGAFLYDPDADITWVSDWNLAWSTNFGRTGPVFLDVVSGKMNWETANDWAAGLTLAGSDAWRLPSVSIDRSCYFSFPRPANAISSCTSGEISTLWTSTLGGDYSDRPGELENQDMVTLFDNMQAGEFYWTASLNELNPSSASSFSTFGSYNFDGLDERLFAVAVHDGDVAAGLPEPVIPEPVLEPRRDGLFLYDPVNDKTWLADANQPWSTSYSDVVNDNSMVRADGRMTFDAAQTWVDQLVVDGVDGWRLPMLTEFDFGCTRDPANTNKLATCTEGDFTELWVDILLNGSSDKLMETTQLADARLFDHWQVDAYWTGSLNALDPDGDSAHVFFADGGYVINSITDFGHVIAVRDGDVGEAVSAVPAPAAVWLFGTALIGLVGFSKRRKTV